MQWWVATVGGYNTIGWWHARCDTSRWRVVRQDPWRYAVKGGDGVSPPRVVRQDPQIVSFHTRSNNAYPIGSKILTGNMWARGANRTVRYPSSLRAPVWKLTIWHMAISQVLLASTPAKYFSSDNNSCPNKNRHKRWRYRHRLPITLINHRVI